MRTLFATRTQTGLWRAVPAASGGLTSGSHHNQEEPRPEDVVVVEHDERWEWKGICIR